MFEFEYNHFLSLHFPWCVKKRRPVHLKNKLIVFVWMFFFMLIITFVNLVKFRLYLPNIVDGQWQPWRAPLISFQFYCHGAIIRCIRIFSLGCSRLFNIFSWILRKIWISAYFRFFVSRKENEVAGSVVFHSSLW